jgi:hypothetical protein
MNPKFSKIEEEFREVREADDSGQKILLFLEIQDLLLSIYNYAYLKYGVFAIFFMFTWPLRLFYKKCRFKKILFHQKRETNEKNN